MRTTLQPKNAATRVTGESTVLRNFGFALLLMLLGTQAAAAQDWAVKMFDRTSHDFGSVARGAKAVGVFKIKNIYEETVHIAGVRSSCGCSSPRVVNPTLKTYETGEIVVKYNTGSFLGYKSATITVTIDQPFYAEVQLQVQGYIRSDVVFNPGAVQFGAVDQGQTAEQKVAVNYAGRGDWRLLDVQSAYQHVEVEVHQTNNIGGQISYELLVRLKDDAPAGYINEQLVLVTNDDRMQRIPLTMEGRVVPDVTVSPSPLYLGDLKPGETVTKQLVVRGKRPFKITDIACGDKSFQFEKPDESKRLHLVGVTFTANQAGKIETPIEIKTDTHQGVAASVTAYANVAGTPLAESGN
jgi:hypothetical protein